MEAADQNIRLEPVDYIHDSPVGTSAEKDFFIVFFQKQILLMAEIFRKECIALQSGKIEIPEIMSLFFLTAGIEGYPSIDDSRVFCEEQTVVSGKGSVQADVFFGTMIMWFKGVTAQIDRSGPVYIQKCGQTAAVVVVAVRKNCDIYSCKINAERGGIFREEVSLAHVKEEFMTYGFDVQA